MALKRRLTLRFGEWWLVNLFSHLPFPCPPFSSCSHCHQQHHHHLSFLWTLLLFSLNLNVFQTLLFTFCFFCSHYFLSLDFSNKLNLFSALTFSISVTPKFTKTSVRAFCASYLTPAVAFFFYSKRNVCTFYFMAQAPQKEQCRKNSPLYSQFQAQITSALRTIHQGWHPSTLKCLYNWSTLWSYRKFYMETLSISLLACLAAMI